MRSTSRPKVLRPGDREDERQLAAGRVEIREQASVEARQEDGWTPQGHERTVEADAATFGPDQ